MCNCTRLSLCDEHLRQQVVGSAFHMPLPDYGDCCNIAITPVIVPINTVINFTQPGSITVGAADQTLVATSNSGAPITFSSSNTAIATIVNGKLHAVAPGSLTITANQIAVPGYTAGIAPKTVTIVAAILKLANPTVTASNITSNSATINVTIPTNGNQVVLNATWDGGSANTTINGTGAKTWALSSLPATTLVAVTVVAKDTTGVYQDSDTVTNTFTTSAALRTIRWGYFDTDPSGSISPSTTFQFNKTIAPGFSSSGALNFSASGDQKFLAVESDADQTTFNKWASAGLDGGTIPDFAYQAAIVVGGKKYVVSRNPQTLDTNNPIITFTHV